MQCVQDLRVKPMQALVVSLAQEGARVRRRKTDYGTIILHWLVVGATIVAFVTGLRIATETPDRTWLNWLDAVLPRASVWVPHMEAAVVLIAVSIGYAIYLIKSGLTRRVVLDKIRLRGLVGRKQARLGSLSVLLVWTFFATMLTLIVSGGFLYFGVSAGYDMVTIHWFATWMIPVFATFTCWCTTRSAARHNCSGYSVPIACRRRHHALMPWNC